MNEVLVDDATLDALRERNPRFHPGAYRFTLAALQRVMEGLDRPRHISGRELAEGVRDLALARFGLLARTVLGHWGIHATEDLGGVVFTLVEAGILVKQEGDHPRDFEGLFDFEEVFERNYPWCAGG